MTRCEQITRKGACEARATHRIKMQGSAFGSTHDYDVCVKHAADVRRRLRTHGYAFTESRLADRGERA